MSQSNQISRSHHLSSGILICSRDHEQTNVHQTSQRELSELGTTDSPLLCFAHRKQNFLSIVVHLTLHSAEEIEGHGEGVGDVREQSECATASTMMTHSVPCETKACKAFNRHWSHKERTAFSLMHVREGLTVPQKNSCHVLRNR